MRDNIITHHPSGNLNPSQADIDLTKKMKEAGKFLEVSVLDHIIITSESYYSFADECLKGLQNTPLIMTSR